MRTGVDLVENYKRLLQSLDGRKDENGCDDQEVPVAQIAGNQQSMKSTIKIEQTHQQDFCSLADVFVDSDIKIEPSYPIDDFNTSSVNISQSEYFLSNPKNFVQTTTTAPSSFPSATMGLSVPNTFSTAPQSLEVVAQSLSLSSTSLSFSSSSPSAFSSSTPSVFSSSSQSAFKPTPISKTKTYVTGLAGSGCTVTTNSSDFLFHQSPLLVEDQLQEEHLEYTDLDKPVSFYDDFDNLKSPVSPLQTNTPIKPLQMPVENVSRTLEDVVQFMQEVILKDSESLNIPFDPQMWTCEHVCRWVDWVCQKNGLDNVSSQVVNYNGHNISNWNYDDFYSSFGTVGQFLYNELDLWKAANSCQSTTEFTQQQNDFMNDSNVFPFTPSSSPTLSNHGRYSPDSTSVFLSHDSEMSEEDNVFYPEVKTSIKSESVSNSKIFPKRVPGRGHKKSIALWQFLRKLLLSDQNYGCITWIDRKAGIFKIVDSKKVATLWGAEKNRPAMNYDKLSRSVRQYYKKGIIKKPEQSKRLLYQFCPDYL